MKNNAFLILFVFLSFITAIAAPPVEDGKAIFTTRCASCHNVNKALTGPALAGIHERRSMDWIVNFIHSSQTMVKTGDKDAVAVFEKFNKFPMPDHPDLTEENIKSVVEYIKTEAKTTEEKAPFAKPGKIRPNYTPLSINDYGFFLTFIALVFVLIAGLVALVKVKALQREQRGEV